MLLQHCSNLAKLRKKNPGPTLKKRQYCMEKTQHCIGCFPYKSCLLVTDQHLRGNFLLQCWPRKIQTKLQLDYFPAQSCLLTVGQHCACNFCKVGPGRSR